MATRLHANFPSDFILCSIAIGATLTYTDPMAPGIPTVTIPIENIYKVIYLYSRQLVLSFFDSSFSLFRFFRWT